MWRIAPAAVVLLIISLTVSAGATGRPSQDPGPAGSTAPSAPSDCPRPATGPTDQPAPLRPGTAICGGRQVDKVRSEYGHPIWVYQSNDTIFAKNGHPDKIWGGPGPDAAFVDPGLDTVVGVERCNGKPKQACPKQSTKRSAGAAKELIYPAYQAILECRLEFGTGKRQIWLPLEPTMRAVDATSRPDWQQLAWSALLYQKVGEQWQFLYQNDWLWDHTYDEQIFEFPGNFWRKFDTRQRWFVWFYPPSAGEYRVAIKYHWYATPLVPERESLYWAGRHYGDFDNGTHEWCVFPS